MILHNFGAKTHNTQSYIAWSNFQVILPRNRNQTESHRRPALPRPTFLPHLPQQQVTMPTSDAKPLLRQGSTYI